MRPRSRAPLRAVALAILALLAACQSVPADDGRPSGASGSPEPTIVVPPGAAGGGGPTREPDRAPGADHAPTSIQPETPPPAVGASAIPEDPTARPSSTEQASPAPSALATENRASTEASISSEKGALSAALSGSTFTISQASAPECVGLEATFNADHTYVGSAVASAPAPCLPEYDGWEIGQDSHGYTITNRDGSLFVARSVTRLADGSIMLERPEGTLTLTPK
ncbi:hypothetical protein [Actinomyces marmotae]|uniref:Alkaline proteinase inhibitor/ Outer membrane lipoprotein Omp19 domain-containing protein n=1 Tax=Actinomyces marmotae TaxID=2737173 RepID=A0A6M8B9M3_9ACTO|nr:hypothetical protein [Actinomyces marmotae]QKD79913.1 hypothetical protein HPC72_06405 [Actinomyces marmotae]